MVRALSDGGSADSSEASPPDQAGGVPWGVPSPAKLPCWGKPSWTQEAPEGAAAEAWSQPKWGQGASQDQSVGSFGKPLGHAPPAW